MGATLTAAWFDNGRLSIAHVGDSRAYLLRRGTLQQLTNDHSLARNRCAAASSRPRKRKPAKCRACCYAHSALTPKSKVDVDEVASFPATFLLLCSDGLTRMVTEPKLPLFAGGDRPRFRGPQAHRISQTNAAALITLRSSSRAFRKSPGVGFPGCVADSAKKE